jgi:hypothetical protein
MVRIHNPWSLPVMVVCVYYFLFFEWPFTAHCQTWNLEQNWTAEEREQFYFTAQGSQLIPFKWFLELEQVDSEKPFRDDQNMRRYGFLPAPSSKLNPEGLPVGFVRDGVNPVANEVAGLESAQQDVIAAATRFGIKRAYLGPEFDEKLYPNEQQAWFGLTCAACHTHEMAFNGKTLRIDGGASQADAESFLRDLGVALQATVDTPEKLKRFANAVGQGGGDLAEFKSKVGQIAEAVNRWNAHLFLVHVI